MAGKADLRQVIADTTIVFEKERFTLTASFGVASCTCDIDTLVRQADLAMYRSKEFGRNTVICDE